MTRLISEDVKMKEVKMESRKLANLAHLVKKVK